MSDILDMYYHELDQKDHDNAFNNAFEFDTAPPLQQRFDELSVMYTVLQKKLADANQHIIALQEIHKDLQQECGKKAKILSDRHIQNTYNVAPAIAEMAGIITRLESANRALTVENEQLAHKTMAHEQVTVSPPAIEQHYEQRIKELEERLFVSEKKNAELHEEISVHAPVHQTHSELYYAYFKFPASWRPHWEHDLINMMQELKERLPVHMSRHNKPTDYYNSINKAIEKVLIPFHEHLYAQIALIPEEPLFIHYNFITYTKQYSYSKSNGIFGYITVITRGAVYTMHNALLRPSFCISGSESLNAGWNINIPTGTINIPTGTFDISSEGVSDTYPKNNSFEFLRYKKIKHLVIPCIEAFVARNCGYITEHSIDNPFCNKFESVNQSIERMTNIRDTLVDLCTV